MIPKQTQNISAVSLFIWGGQIIRKKDVYKDSTKEAIIEKSWRALPRKASWNKWKCLSYRINDSGENKTYNTNSFVYYIKERVRSVSKKKTMVQLGPKIEIIEKRGPVQITELKILTINLTKDGTNCL